MMDVWFWSKVSTHDSSVWEWIHRTIYPLHGPGPIPGRGGVFQGNIPGWSYALPYTQVWQDQRLGPQLKQRLSGALLEECPQSTDMPMDQTWSMAIKKNPEIIWSGIIIYISYRETNACFTMIYALSFLLFATKIAILIPDYSFSWIGGPHCSYLVSVHGINWPIAVWFLFRFWLG